MAQPAITVYDLTKTYKVPEREPGLAAAVRSLGKRTYKTVEAVCSVGFQVEPGEMVGFIGPNGAGKTTTLKMLSGLLQPTSGECRVLGYKPGERKPAFLKQISMVMGNKGQMIWDIPPLDSFRVLGEIYSIPPEVRKKTEDELIDLLEMRELLNRPVRNLSLGERMKCELVAGLIHKPKVLFLDEPTLGLDVSMQRKLREFFREYNQRSGVTVILTSHYMADVMALCPRVILIHHGRLLYDGELSGLAQKMAPFKLLRVTLGGEVDDLHLPEGLDLIERDNERLTLRAPRADAPAFTAQILASLPVADLTVEDPPIEAVIDQVYREGL